MEKVSNQQIPLWDRPSSTRGHLSSVDKAVQAHRDRVDARQSRTQNRLDASREINSRFFVSPENMAPLSPQHENLALTPDLIEDPAVTTQPIALPEADSAAAAPIGMDELYTELSASPIRALAPQIIEAEAVEAGVDGQSDEVPKGTYVDYTV